MTEEVYDLDVICEQASWIVFSGALPELDFFSVRETLYVITAKSGGEITKGMIIDEDGTIRHSDGRPVLFPITPEQMYAYKDSHAT